MPRKKHLVFVVNPRSGVQRQKAIESGLRQYLDQAAFSFEIKETTHARHGVQLAREAAAAGAFGVVAVGGDGSVSDVAAGLLGSTAALGIIPMGSGNGMARTLGIPRHLRGALAVLNQQTLLPTDIGYANEKPFISNAGLGFDALIAAVFAHSSKRGFLNYAKLSAQHFFSYQPGVYEISANGEVWQETAFFINVANGRQFGYNFLVAPQASYTDGLLDVVILRLFPKWKGLGITARGFRGSLLQSPYVRHFQCSSIRILPAAASYLQTDGDAWPCSGPVDFRVAAAALKVFVPS